MYNRFAINDKLYARPITDDDTDMVVGWRNNPRVVNNFLHREKVTREDHINWLRTKVDTGIVEQFVLIETATERPVGCVYLRDIDREASECEYGVFIGEDDCVGLGYGNAVCEWAVGYARDVLGLKKMILRVLEGNESAYKSYVHAGFTQTEVIPDYIDGRDLIMMERML